MALNLRWRDATTLPVDLDVIRPDVLASIPAPQVSTTTVRVGSGVAELGELFAIDGDGGDGTLVLQGDMPGARGIGHAMASGSLIIEGRVGAQLGAEMAGGVINVRGHVGDWAGSGMRGGVLHIRGTAGDNLGAAPPGARLGMRGGTILVDGDVGRDAGLAMRRGLIAIGGSAGRGLGRSMIAGSIVLLGDAGPGLGLGMKRGTIALLRAESPAALPLPTFRHACCYRPPFLTILLRHLRALGFPVPAASFTGVCDRYNGDLVEGGLGEILVWRGGTGEGPAAWT